jgi:hypothetical protein
LFTTDHGGAALHTILPATPDSVQRESSPAFTASRDRFERIVGWLEGRESGQLAHGELEERLEVEGRELLRQMLQDHLDLRAQREPRLEAVVGADGVARGSVETGHERGLLSVFGKVEVSRMAYRQRGHANLHPADSDLNLPVELHSHGLRRLAVLEGTRGSFDDVREAVRRSTGQRLGKRQLEALVQRAAADFDAFYEERKQTAGNPDDVLVISCDGKGVVMRPDALRAATAQAAARSTNKLATRLSKGEKRNRKRMAEVGGVYDARPVPRTPDDIMAGAHDGEHDARPAPRARNKWLMASVVEDAATVVSRVFDEAERRDPDHRRTWVALVDGNNHQIDRIQAEAHARQIDVTIVVDFVHVLEYLWKAAWCFYNEGDPDAERWVRGRARAVLKGQAAGVAAAIRRKAARERLDRAARTTINECAVYLVRKRPYLDYPSALKRGWPIATGVIEGACRHLVKDRMDITGARWSLDGAEAVLKMRAVVSNRDFEEYWHYHLAHEHQRVHCARYATASQRLTLAA